MTTNPPFVAEAAKNGVRRRLISEHRLESIALITITTLTTLRDEGDTHG
jgi:hypothetical protein